MSFINTIKQHALFTGRMAGSMVATAAIAGTYATVAGARAYSRTFDRIAQQRARAFYEAELLRADSPYRFKAEREAEAMLNEIHSANCELCTMH